MQWWCFHKSKGFPKPLGRYGRDSESCGEKIVLIDLRNSNATKCYGCDGFYWMGAHNPTPNAPFNIVFKVHCHQIHRKRGMIKVTITAKPGHVFFHMIAKCCKLKDLKVSRKSINISQVILTECHMLQLKKDFGI